MMMIDSPEHNLALAPLLSIVNATQRIGQRVHPHHGGSGYLLSANRQVEFLLNLNLPFTALSCLNLFQSQLACISIQTQ